MAGWRIRHFVHRHEPPVLAGDLQVPCCCASASCSLAGEHVLNRLRGRWGSWTAMDCNANNRPVIWQVLGMTDDVVAVSKPACMPVHVAGQHRKNTVAGRLQVTAR